MGLYSYPNRHTLKIVKLFPPGPLVHFYVVGWPKRGVNCKHVYTHRGSKQATGVDSKTCPLYNQRMRGGGAISKPQEKTWSGSAEKWPGDI